MKRAGWITTAAVAAVGVIGGVTAYALTQADEPAVVAETPAPSDTPSTEPDSTPSETPEPSSEPTPEATEAGETPEPETTYSADEALYISYLHTGNTTLDTLEGISDEEFLAGGYEFCDQARAGVPYYDIWIYPDNKPASNVVRREAAILFCPEVYEQNVGPLD